MNFREAKRLGLAIMLTGLCLANAPAQVAAPAPSVSDSPLQLNVLSSRTINLTTHTVTFNQVETPVLKPQPIPAPAAAGSSSLASSASQPPALQDTGNYFTLFFSATRYDNQTTEIDLPYKGQNYVFWSNVDLSCFSYVNRIQVKQTTYSLIFSAQTGLIKDLTDWNLEVVGRGLSPSLIHPIPALPTLQGQSSGMPNYLLVSPTTGADPQVLQAIADLHAYYNANKTALIAAYQASRAKALTQEQWLKTHPPQPENIVINYFPIKSARLSAKPNQGGGQ
jgi:hypothetical protein